MNSLENEKINYSDIYRQLASHIGALIPPDMVLAKAWGSTNGAPSGARNRLRLDGYEFQQNQDGYWKVILIPASDHYQIDKNGTYKLHHEKVTELPKSVILKGNTARHNKWVELHDLIDNMEVDEIQRIHFNSKKVAMQCQGAAYGYCKKQLKPFAMSCIIIENKETNGFWLYIQKIAKNPDEWGKGPNAGKPKQRRTNRNI